MYRSWYFFFQPRVNLDILLAKWLSNICTCNQSIQHWLKYFNSQDGARYIYYYSIVATYCGHWSNEHHFNFLRGCRFGLGWVQKIFPLLFAQLGDFSVNYFTFCLQFFIAPPLPPLITKLSKTKLCMEHEYKMRYITEKKKRLFFYIKIKKIYMVPNDVFWLHT